MSAPMIGKSPARCAADADPNATGPSRGLLTPNPGVPLALSLAGHWIGVGLTLPLH